MTNFLMLNFILPLSFPCFLSSQKLYAILAILGHFQLSWAGLIWLKIPRDFPYYYFERLTCMLLQVPLLEGPGDEVSAPAASCIIYVILLTWTMWEKPYTVGIEWNSVSNDLSYWNMCLPRLWNTYTYMRSWRVYTYELPQDCSMLGTTDVITLPGKIIASWDMKIQPLYGLERCNLHCRSPSLHDTQSR